MNEVALNGEFTQKAPMRYTPAGLAVLEGVFHHQGEVMEAGAKRKLLFDFPAIAIGEIATALDKEPLGKTLEVTGFIAPRSARSRQLIVHITQYS